MVFFKCSFTNIVNNILQILDATTFHLKTIFMKKLSIVKSLGDFVRFIENNKNNLLRLFNVYETFCGLYNKNFMKIYASEKKKYHKKNETKNNLKNKSKNKK